MAGLESIVNALVYGAASALKPKVESAVSQGYEALRSYIVSKFEAIELNESLLEGDEQSRRKLEEDLRCLEVHKDSDAVSLAEKLLEAMEKTGMLVSGDLGLHIENVDVGGSLKIEDVHASSFLDMAVKDAVIKEDFVVTGLSASDYRKKEA